MTDPHPIRHVLLDIEGTTCPVSFVTEVLFPYASRELRPFLQRHQVEEPIQRLLKEVDDTLAKDPSPQAVTMRSASARSNDQETFGLETLCSYLEWLISADHKVTSLKDLQGMIWEEGYQRGEILAPLFEDVPTALQTWREQGLQLSVFSSGSIQAQKLLYSHTKYGDLSHYFVHWFDTRTGGKDLPSSYEEIATKLDANPNEVLFISDAVAELKAASSAKMAVVFSQRASNPHQDAEGFPSVDDFSKLTL